MGAHAKWSLTERCDTLFLEQCHDSASMMQCIAEDAAAPAVVVEWLHALQVRLAAQIELEPMQ